MKLDKIKDVQLIDQYVATMDFLAAMGFDNTQLTGMELIDIKRALWRTIEDQIDDTMDD